MDELGVSPNLHCTSWDLPYTWKRAKRGWGHSLHKLSPYIGAFPPSLARYFIMQLSDEGDVILDPFSGGGTTLLEALLLGRQAIASDVFYYAYLLSSAKAQPLSLPQFESYLQDVLRKAESVEPDLEELNDPDLRASFSKATLDQLLRLRTVLSHDESREATFTKAVICGILHGPSAMFLSLPQKDTVSSTPAYVRRYAKEHGLVPPDRNVYECAMNKATRALRDPIPQVQGKVYALDARNLAPIRSESVDLIVTSPPYMSVLDYSWNNWLRLWWLARDRVQERSKLVLTGNERKYRDFIRAALQEMYRVMKPNSAAVIVVGDVKRKRGDRTEIINSALLIAHEAKRVGFSIEALIDDTYPLHNRSMLVYNSLKWSYTPDEHVKKSSVLIDRCLVLGKGYVKWRNRPVDWARPFAEQLSIFQS